MGCMCTRPNNNEIIILDLEKHQNINDSFNRTDTLKKQSKDKNSNSQNVKSHYREDSEDITNKTGFLLNLESEITNAKTFSK
jgi:hypothetical protein